MIMRHFGGLPTVRVGIWALHFGIDSNLQSSEKRIARLIASLDLDVVGLVESDLMRPLTGQRDLGRLIAAELPTKYYVDYGPPPRRHTWGCTLISRYEILRSQHFSLPSPDGEIACAILAEIKLAPGVSVQVLMSHNGQEEDVVGREQQSAVLADLIRAHANTPLIFAGYLVAKPHSEDYHRLFKATKNPGSKHGPLTDIDPDIKDRWCLYIGHNQRFIYPLGFVRVHHGDITDTELQAGSFAVLPTGLHPPDFEQKWELIVREAKSKTSSEYFKRWYFDEQPSLCPVGGSQVCEHYYHLRRHYF
jgi:endonuclease/exonuclease/phosphatase family metal-dependent hydrolase